MYGVNTSVQVFQNGTPSLWQNGTVMELQHITNNNWLSTSWDRSEQAGLKQRRRPDDIRVTSAFLQDRRHQLNFLIDAVKQFALPLFNQLFAHSDSRLILTDADGVIIGSWGNLNSEKTDRNCAQFWRVLARKTERHQRHWHCFSRSQTGVCYWWPALYSTSSLYQLLSKSNLWSFG